MRREALSGSLIFLDRAFLVLTLFVVGAVIMMIELIGTRILAPFFGTTIYTWSSLITVTLVSLAIGYFVGGVIADKKPDLRILYLIVFLACIWMIFISPLRSKVLLMSSSYDIKLGTILSATALFAFPLTLLGTALPFAIKMETERLKTLGTTAGSLYAVSTIGSFMGTILTGFYLIPNMEVGRIILLGALSLLVISTGWFLSRKEWKFSLSLITVFIFSFYMISSIAAYPELQKNVELVFKGQSLYGEVKVVDKGWRRYLLIDATPQIAVNRFTGEYASSYPRYLEMGIFFVPEARDALAIGLGAGSIQGKFEEYDLNVDTVEIDPLIMDVAAEYFSFEGDNIYVGDGRYFVQNSDKKYDIVILDAFSGSTIPFHLITLEMFHEISDILDEEGLLVINTVGSVDSKVQSSIMLTLMQTYPEVHAFATVDNPPGNIVFFAFKKSLKEKGGLSSYGLKNLRIACGDGCLKYPYNEYPYILEKKRVSIDLEEARVLRDDLNPSEVWQAEYASVSLKNYIDFFGPGVMLK